MSGEWWHAGDAFLADAWDELAGLDAEREAMWAGVELAERAELAEREAWGGREPSASYADWLAEGQAP